VHAQVRRGERRHVSWSRTCDAAMLAARVQAGNRTTTGGRHGDAAISSGLGHTTPMPGTLLVLDISRDSCLPFATRRG